MDSQLQEIFEHCQRRFPTVRLSLDVFQARVLGILSSEMRLADDGMRQAFEKIHHEDLFLAIACAQNDRVAWEHLADEYFPLLRHFAVRSCGNLSEGEDLAQEIIARLLNEKQRLAGYNGRGSLAGWLRVAVSHAAVDRFRRMRRQASLGGMQNNESFCTLANPDMAEEDALDSKWGPVISQIAGECLGGLAPRDRLLLSLHYLHGVPLKDLGRQFGIHEATVSRWLDRKRREIRKQVERELRKKHGLRSSEIQSLWKWVSPSALAESVAGSSPAAEACLSSSSGQIQQNSAIPGDSGVMKKEELR